MDLAKHIDAKIRRMGPRMDEGVFESEDDLLVFLQQRDELNRVEQENLDHSLACSIYEAQIQLLLQNQDTPDDFVDSIAEDIIDKDTDESLVKCSCCLEDHEEYRVLPCEHVFCMKCIATRCRMGVRDRSLVPAQCCRKEFPLDYVATVLTSTELFQSLCRGTWMAQPWLAVG